MSHTAEEFEPGDRVIYHPTPKTAQIGTVTSVMAAVERTDAARRQPPWVFVRYDGYTTAQATHPRDLTWLVNQ